MNEYCTISMEKKSLNHMVNSLNRVYSIFEAGQR